MRVVSFTFWISILFLCLLVFCDTALPMGTHPMKVFSVEQEGQTLEVKPGESFLLVLPNPASGGYVVEDHPDFDSEILILLKMEKKPPPNRRRAGDFGSIEWVFQARKEGLSDIAVRAFRPWEKDRVPIVIFEASVQVAE